MKFKSLFLLPFLLCVFTVGFFTSANATSVSVELVLLADVSGSLDSADFQLQQDGYAAAFKDEDIIDLIESTSGGIAVTLVYWSTYQDVAVEWTQITTEAESLAFAAAIEVATRPSAGLTYLTDALSYGSTLFANDFESETQIIDVSGDGADTVTGYTVADSPSTQAARDAAVALGVDQINALWIDDRDYFGDDPEDIIDAVLYGETNVIAGDGAFSVLVQDFDGFEEAIQTKIYTELDYNIGAVPEPATWLLIGIGFLGLAGVSRKKLLK